MRMTRLRNREGIVEQYIIEQQYICNGRKDSVSTKVLVQPEDDRAMTAKWIRKARELNRTIAAGALEAAMAEPAA